MPDKLRRVRRRSGLVKVQKKFPRGSYVTLKIPPLRVLFAASWLSLALDILPPAV